MAYVTTLKAAFTQRRGFHHSTVILCVRTQFRELASPPPFTTNQWLRFLWVLRRRIIIIIKTCIVPNILKPYY
jgi:hypothetical protein